MNEIPRCPFCGATAPAVPRSASKIVRLVNSPIPQIGLVVGEDSSITGMPAWLVRVYGYVLKTEAWLKSGCSEPTTEIPSYIDIAGWQSLALEHERTANGL
jgi:hypothetical protein